MVMIDFEDILDELNDDDGDDSSSNLELTDKERYLLAKAGGERVPLELWKKEGQRFANDARIKISDEKKTKIAGIRRDAIVNFTEKLTEPVSREQLQKLITILTDDLRKNASDYSDAIEKYVLRLLRREVPSAILKVYDEYKNIPGLIPRSPGFLYKASQEYGQGLTKRIDLDLPCFIPQFTEQEALMRVTPDRCFRLDKMVVSYYSRIERMNKKQIAYAMKFYGVYTRYELLVADAEAYDVYIKNKLYDMDE